MLRLGWKFTPRTTHPYPFWGEVCHPGSWPKVISSLPTSHHAYPGMTRHCDVVQHSQARHHCWTDCTFGGEHGRSLWEEETLLREPTHGMWSKGWACQVMPIEVSCCGFICRKTTSYLSRLGLTNRARQRATQQLQAAAERASYHFNMIFAMTINPSSLANIGMDTNGSNHMTLVL